MRPRISFFFTFLFFLQFDFAAAQSKIIPSVEFERVGKLCLDLTTKGNDNIGSLRKLGYKVKRGKKRTIYSKGVKNAMFGAKGVWVAHVKNNAGEGCQIRLHGIDLEKSNRTYRSLQNYLIAQGYSEKRGTAFSNGYFTDGEKKISFNGSREGSSVGITIFLRAR